MGAGIERGCLGHPAGQGAVAARSDRSLNGRQRIDLTPAGRIVGHVGAAAGAVIIGNRGGCLLNDRLGAGIVAHQAGSGLPHQGHQAGHVGGRHGGSGPTAVMHVTALQAGADVDPRRQHLRLEIRIATRVDRVRIVGGAPVRVGCVLTIALPGRADPGHVTIASRIAHRIEPRRIGVAAVGRVAVGKDRVDAGRVPVVHYRLVPIVIRGATVAPRVVDHVRPLVGIGRVGIANGVRRRNPLGAFEQGRVRAAGGGAAVAGNPLSARGHANLIDAAVVADHGTHRMRAMAVIIGRNGGAIDGAQPIVVMAVGTASERATVLRLKRFVGITDAGINVGDHDSIPVIPQSPDLVGPNVADVGLDCSRAQDHRPFGRLDQGHGPPGSQGVDLGELRQAVKRSPAGRPYQDHIVDPVRPVCRILFVQVIDDGCLGAPGCLLQRLHDKTAALVPIHGRGGREVRPIAQVDEVTNGAVRLHLSPQFRFDLHPVVLIRRAQTVRVQGRRDHARDS